ncbi:MAG TPA: SDR family NAD(P)-dependent oxidoreductase [Chitinophagaceae bacterium]|nr:SDR family NAD(P)-dependent oxidoreductase [Chitinophagaceae bacterium]
MIEAQNTGNYALVAGGSKGIGFALAEALAKRGYHLILVARNLKDLATAQESLQKRFTVRVEILSYDLSLEKSQHEIASWCTGREFSLKIVCNVAGVGGAKDFLDQPLDQTRYMTALNLGMPVAMTQLLLPLLEKNLPAYILNVASMAAFAPIPVKNLYSATKSGVLFFSLALRQQLRDRRISVSCLAPGPVFTKPEIVEETKKQLGWLGMRMAVPPHRVGEIAIRKLLRGRMLIVPGTLAGMVAAILRILPARWVANIYKKMEAV